jgi:hypothetical protein
MHNPSIGFTLIFIYVMIVHLRVGVGCKLVALALFPYKNTLFTPAMD